MTERGKFYTLDGADNAGKTTLLKRIKAEYEQRGEDVIFTREPGGTDEAEEIRRLLLNRDTPLDADTQLHLAFASRDDHVKRKIRPALQKGQTVWSDRFYPATYVYQVQLGGANESTYQAMVDEVVTFKGCIPDLQIFLDLPAEETVRRDQNDDRQGQQLVFEKMEVEAKDKIRMGYIKYIRQAMRPEIPFDSIDQGVDMYEGYLPGSISDVRRPKARVFLVDGMCDRDFVFNSVMAAVSEYEEKGRLRQWWSSNRPEFQDVVNMITSKDKS